MNPRISLFTGALTTVLFLAVGISMLAAGGTLWGGVITALGVLRGALWLRQVQLYRRATAQEREEPQQEE